jgi:hypothetical protein
MEVASRRRSKSNSDLAAGASARGHSETSPAKGNEATTEAKRWWLGECPDTKADETCHLYQRSPRFSSASTTTGLAEVYLSRIQYGVGKLKKAYNGGEFNVWTRSIN